MEDLLGWAATWSWARDELRVTAPNFTFTVSYHATLSAEAQVEVDMDLKLSEKNHYKAALYWEEVPKALGDFRSIIQDELEARATNPLEVEILASGIMEELYCLTARMVPYFTRESPRFLDPSHLIESASWYAARIDLWASTWPSFQTSTT